MVTDRYFLTARWMNVENVTKVMNTVSKPNRDAVPKQPACTTPALSKWRKP